MLKKANELCTSIPIVNKVKNVPIVKISSIAVTKMKEYVALYNEEIAWLGFVKKEKNIYDLYDVIMIKCHCKPTFVEIDEEALSELGQKLFKEGKKFNELRAWGHSHVNMAVSPSGTDDSTFEEYYQNSDFFFRIIMNKKDDIRIDLAVTEENILYNNVDFEIYSSTKEETNLIEKIEKINTEIIKLEGKLETLEEDLDNLYANIKEDCKKEVEACAKSTTITSHINNNYSLANNNYIGYNNHNLYNNYNYYTRSYEDDDNYPMYKGNAKVTDNKKKQEKTKKMKS